ncbi:MAG: SDR family oxidoreductase, partial [Gammaproteobacteria bacterium]|nr:SDR family oxidoreductase [Gammaproteobacteria bacterium]
ISSIAGVTGNGSSIAYAASKGAVNTMTKSLARVLGPEIRINAICPGFVGTRWQRDGQGDKYDAVVEQVEKSTPLRHACTAEDIAESVVMLVDGGRFITGETLLVDAGSHL